MAGRKSDYKSDEKLRAEYEALTGREEGSSTAPPGIPDLSHEACACGRFGPWGDGKAFYCAEHAPPELRYAGAFFAEMME